MNIPNERKKNAIQSFLKVHFYASNEFPLNLNEEIVF